MGFVPRGGTMLSLISITTVLRATSLAVIVERSVRGDSDLDEVIQAMTQVQTLTTPVQ